jgi:hypothetical protein
MMSTCGGTTIEAMTTTNSHFRPVKSSREKAYAASAEIASVITVIATEVQRLFSAQM